MSFYVHTPLNTVAVDGTKTVASTTVPETLVAVDTFVREVTIYPLRANTGQVYIGITATNDSQHIPPPYILTAAPGTFINLKKIYIDVTVNGEGVYFLYTA